MNYVEIPPALQLRPYVQCLWALEDEAPPPGAPSEPVLPDGCMEIVFHVGSPFRRRTLGRDDGATQHRTAVVGQLDRALVLDPTGAVGLVGVRLKPAGAAAFLGHAVGEIAGTSVRLEDVWPREAARIEDAVYGAGSIIDALAGLETLLLQRAAAARAPETGLLRAVDLATATEGAASVKALADAAGVSTRQLARRFGSDVGLSPKRFLRVLRVQRAARMLGTGRRPIETALDCGYYDEAHLHRDFREVTGGPPGAWARGDHAFADRLLLG